MRFIDYFVKYWGSEIKFIVLSLSRYKICSLEQGQIKSIESLKIYNVKLHHRAQYQGNLKRRVR